MIRFTITYDITKNSKRNKLVKILEEFGERVQYSIFEFELTEAQYINLMKRLKEKDFLKPDLEHPDDSINVYHFDENTKKKIQRYGKKEPIIDKRLLLYI